MEEQERRVHNAKQQRTKSAKVDEVNEDLAKVSVHLGCDAGERPSGGARIRPGN